MEGGFLNPCIPRYVQIPKNAPYAFSLSGEENPEVPIESRLKGKKCVEVLQVGFVSGSAFTFFRKIFQIHVLSFKHKFGC